MSSALAGGFFTTEPPGTPSTMYLKGQNFQLQPQAPGRVKDWPLSSVTWLMSSSVMHM